MSGERLQDHWSSGLHICDKSVLKQTYRKDSTDLVEKDAENSVHTSINKKMGKKNFQFERMSSSGESVTTCIMVRRVFPWSFLCAAWRQIINECIPCCLVSHSIQIGFEDTD